MGSCVGLSRDLIVKPMFIKHWKTDSYIKGTIFWPHIVF